METTGGLTGFRVLDLTGGIAGGYAGRLLAGFGADVIKVEDPARLPSLREAGPFVRQEPGPETSILFHYLGAGKRGVALDLGSDDGAASLGRLLATADAVIEDLGPGGLEPFGLSPETLGAAHGGMVVTSLSPFGHAGPYASYLAPSLVQHALDGQISVAGSCERAPLRMGGNLGEYMPGLMAAFLTGAALLEAERSGAGERIDLSNAATTLYTMHQTTAAALNGDWLGRGRYAVDRGLDRVPCADGFVGVHMLSTPGMLESMSALLDMPEMLEDRPAGDALARGEWARRMAPRVRERLASRGRWDVFYAAMKGRLPFGVYLAANELLELEPLHERKYYVELTHAATGPELHPGAPVQMGDDGCAFRIERAAPLLGEHTGEVLGEARTPRSVAARGDAPGLPFAGLRVLDFTAGWAGPLAGQVLGMLGADVIKVEAVQRLDWWRGSGATGSERPYERSPLFNSVNRNKREVTLNLKDPRGKALFRKLAAMSDVLIDNYSTHVLPSLGLGYDDLAVDNPGLVMVAAPAFGSTGSWSQFAGFGTNVEEIAGHSSLTGYEGGPPEQFNSANLTDPLVGLSAALAVTAALRHRQRTGRGQFINVSHVEASVPFLGEAMMDWQLNGALWPRMGNRHPTMSPHNVYRCAGEDAWAAIAVGSDEEFGRLCRVIGAPELAADARFATAAGRKACEDALDARIEAWTRERTARDVERALQAAGVAAGAVLDPAAVLTDPHFLATGAFERIERAFVGTHEYPAFPAKFSSWDARTQRPSPTLGEHNREVLVGLLGVPDAEYVELERDRVIGTEVLA